MSDLKDKEIIDRINYADQKMKSFRDSDAVASRRYIDVQGAYVAASNEEDVNEPSGFYDEDGDTPQEVPVGTPNYLAINNEILISAIAMSSPTLRVIANEDPQQGGVARAGEVVAKAFEHSWDSGDWTRVTQSWLQKVGICGLGTLWYRWDELYGPSFEAVPSRRLFIDPNAVNLNRLEYGGVKVRMSMRKALRLYDPNGENGWFTSGENNFDATSNLDSNIITIKIYWDAKNEVHVFGDKVLHRDDNLYKRVPLIFMEKFIDPRSRLLPLGDNIYASGLNQHVVDLSLIASNMAKHGGQITFADGNDFEPMTKESLEKGEQQQIIFTKGPINPQAPPMYRLAAEQLSPAWAEARREAQDALDSIQGVTLTERGGTTPGVTATQSVMAESRGGARPTQARSDYERGLTRMARAYVEMMQRFGGPTESSPGTNDTRMVWLAFKNVQEVQVIEGSTSFANPATNQQAAMQLYTTVVQSFPMWEGLGTHGMVDKVPNLEALFNDMLRAFSRQNTESYWTKAPQRLSEPFMLPPDLVRAYSVMYKDATPEAKQAIEKTTGLPETQPAQPPVDNSQADGVQNMHHQAIMEQGKQEHASNMQQDKQVHDMRMKLLDVLSHNINKPEDAGNAPFEAEKKKKRKPE